MKFVIRKGSELFNQLQAIKHKMVVASHIATEFLKNEFGPDVTEYAMPHGSISGGIIAVHFPTPPDKNLWALIKGYSDPLYRPKAKNKAMKAKLDALPMVDKEELNKVLNYPVGMVPGQMIWTSRPGFAFHDDFVLIEMHDGHVGHYKAPQGMEEVTVSEYSELCNQISDHE